MPQNMPENLIDQLDMVLTACIYGKSIIISKKYYGSIGMFVIGYYDDMNLYRSLRSQYETMGEALNGLDLRRYSGNGGFTISISNDCNTAIISCDEVVGEE